MLAAAAAGVGGGVVLLLQHEEQREKLRIVRTVLEQGGTFSGINRKVQLKPTKWSRRSSSSKPDAAADADAISQQDAAAAAAAANGGEGRGRTSSTGGGSSGGAGDNKSAAKEKGDKDKGGDEPVVSELLLILKYGGVLTHAGRSQAEDLGKMFRMVMYPRWVCIHIQWCQVYGPRALASNLPRQRFPTAVRAMRRYILCGLTRSVLVQASFK
jgi:hypothetical protein